MKSINFRYIRIDTSISTYASIILLEIHTCRYSYEYIRSLPTFPDLIRRFQESVFFCNMYQNNFHSNSYKIVTILTTIY